MKILILGCNGLLGNTLTKYFFQKSCYETFGFLRDATKLRFFNKEYLENLFLINDVLDIEYLKMKIKELKPDVIINCIGMTNKIKKQDIGFVEKYISVNSIFPHNLKELCFELGIRLIHFSTDCVFSGNKGFYNESEHPDPIDIYGRSKLLGELEFENTITIRKSAIGHELVSKNGLLEWFINQQEKVLGYKETIFSGLTVLELASIIDMYILPNQDLSGIFHISGQPISKYDLLKIIADVYQKQINIIPDHLIKVDRSLNAENFSKLTGYKTKSWKSLIKSMSEFNLLNQ